jgi:DNA-binding SARP family transcriptional activator
MTAFRPGGRLPELRFGILGPVRIEAHGHSVDAGPRKQQIVLAALLCNANALVSVDALAEALWLGSPPRTARKNIQVYVSALRGMIHAGRGPSVSYQTGGYVLHASPAELDSLLFEQLARDASRLRHVRPPSAMAEALAGALELWRGRALDGMRDVPLLDAAAERLDRQFLAVLEDWAEAEIAAGSGAGVVERVTGAAQQHPLRERLRTLQMTALCQAGRQTEALAVYDELRRALARELGLSPSPALEEFYRSVLRGLVPTARSAGRPPSRLPWDPPTFTGRTEVTRQLTAALVRDGHRQVVVTGPLGAGKTALAVHAAHQLDDSFPDGRFFVRLHDADGTARPVEEVVAQLMPPDLAPVPRPEPRGQRGHPVSPGTRHAWQLWLAAHRALVILDGARRESDITPLLPEIGDSAVIVTARCRLAGLEAAHRLLVPPFSIPEALDFLRRMISTDRVAADICSAERIVLATGLLPLGLRVVAERLALLHHVPLREYAARMAGKPSLLDELSAGDTTIRPRLAEAIGELSQPARWGVARLGRLPAAVFTLSEAAAVLDADERTAMRILETLLEASVITVPSAEMFAHAVRYEMPPLIYAYAQEVAAADALEVAGGQNGVPGAR